jgi:hypothetical protein
MSAVGAQTGQAANIAEVTRLTRTGRSVLAQPSGGHGAESGKGENRKFLSVGWAGSASKRRATEMLRAAPVNESFPLANERRHPRALSSSPLRTGGEWQTLRSAHCEHRHCNQFAVRSNHHTMPANSVHRHGLEFVARRPIPNINAVVHGEPKLAGEFASDDFTTETH